MADTKVGVVGAGVIGSGVAQVLARSGFEVRLCDTDGEALDRAMVAIKNHLRLGSLMGAGGAVDVGSVLARIRARTDLSGFEEADFVIENVTEDPDTKADVYRALDSLCPADCIFAANTSCIPISHLASFTRRPPQVVGIHFMNPVGARATVEVIRSGRTSDAAMERTLSLISAIGKQAVVVRDFPGFVSNRILMLTINEAIATLHDGVAAAEDVDRIFRECFGHKLGPLETADLIGLDTILRSLEMLVRWFGDPRFGPAPLLREMVDEGRLGIKSGRGFYCYPEGIAAR